MKTTAGISIWKHTKENEHDEEAEEPGFALLGPKSVDRPETIQIFTELSKKMFACWI